MPGTNHEHLQTSEKQITTESCKNAQFSLPAGTDDVLETRTSCQHDDARWGS